MKCSAKIISGRSPSQIQDCGSWARYPAPILSWETLSVEHVHHHSRWGNAPKGTRHERPTSTNLEINWSSPGCAGLGEWTAHSVNRGCQPVGWRWAYCFDHGA